jgi:hypothetical protein
MHVEGKTKRKDIITKSDDRLKLGNDLAVRNCNRATNELMHQAVSHKQGKKTFTRENVYFV